MSSVVSRDTRSLKAIIEAGEFVVAPGVFDMISARIADRFGFNALYMTGYGICASYLGKPDAGIATYTDMVNRVATIANGTETPLIADADTGFGGLLNVRQTVIGYERAGAQAIQMEDQDMPKKCGHSSGHRIIETEEMVQKVKVAVDSRRNEETLIIARTDALGISGLNAAIDRAGAYREAGADLIFVEAPKTKSDMLDIGQRVSAPLVANMVEGGKTPMLPAIELQSMGFNVALYPGLGMGIMAAALSDGFKYLKENGSSLGIPSRLYGTATNEPSFHQFAGLVEAIEFEQRWSLGSAGD